GIRDIVLRRKERRNQAPSKYPLKRGLGANSEGHANANPGVQYVPTVGTIVVLNFADAIQLTE
ncbi:MAG: hypothetical protein ACKPKO_59375, partial [Candidatus Fonsibacter sp.]